MYVCMYVCIVRSMKIENFKRNITKIHFPDCLKYNCINAAYSDFIYKFMRAIDTIAAVKTIRRSVKIVLKRSYFWSEYRKIGTRNNPVFGHLPRSESEG